MIYGGGKQIKGDAENIWWWTCREARLCVTKPRNDRIFGQYPAHTSVHNLLSLPSSPLNSSPCFIPLMIKGCEQVPQSATMLARARVPGPQLTAGTANLIMRVCLPHSLISCRSLLRGRLPDVNLPGPEHDPTLGRGAGNVTGQRGSDCNVEGTSGRGGPSPSPWCFWSINKHKSLLLLLSNHTGTVQRWFLYIKKIRSWN